MKRYLVLMICSFLLAGTVDAVQFTAEQQANIDKQKEITQRGIELMKEANLRAMEQCDVTRFVVPKPEYNSITKQEEILDTTVKIEWTGACAQGKRDGEGVLTIISESMSHRRIDEKNWTETRVTSTTISEGHLVKGQRIGLWCGTVKVKVETKTQDGKLSPFESVSDYCTVAAGKGKPLAGNFKKQPDGSWRGIGDVTLPAGALEAQSAKLLADAAAGKANLKVDLIGKSQVLDDLVRGSSIALAPITAPIPLKNKRVGIVLSSGTISEMERFKRERAAFIAATSGLSGDAAKYRAKFITASNPDRLLVNVAKVVRKYFGTAQPADDLSGLQQGKFDYALVIDWKDKTRFDLLGKYDSFHNYSEKDPGIAPVCQSMGGFLINSDLKAVKQMNWPYSCSHKWQHEDKGDLSYMIKLSGFFEHEWGEGPDDVGGLMGGLDFFLKR